MFVESHVDKQKLFSESCSLNNKYIVKKLINDVDINKQNEWYESPLFTSIINNYSKISKILIKCKNLKVNQANTLGESPFNFACKLSRVKICKNLLSRDDLNLNQKDIFGRTAIFYICLEKNGFKCFKLLNSNQLKSVDFNIKDKFGKTPLYYLLTEKCLNVDLYVQILKLSNIRIDQQIYELIKSHRNEDSLKYLILYYPKYSDFIHINLKYLKYLKMNYDTNIMNVNKMYSLTVLYTDNFLVSKNRNKKNIIKFFDLTSRLPIEIQMRICYLIYNKSDLIINTENFESQIKFSLSI